MLATVVLLRTRARAERAESAARDQAMALNAEIDRLKALLLSEPQVLVAWAAADDRPDIFGDTTIIVPGNVAERVLAFGSWLEPAAAQRMQHAVDTLRGDGRGFVMTLTTTAGRPLEARRPRRRRPRGAAAARRQRHGARAHRSRRPPRRLARRRGNHARAARFAARPGVGARRQRPPDLRQRRLCARGGGRRFRRRRRPRHSSCSTVPRARNCRARAPPASRYAGRQPAIVAGERRTFDVIDAPSGHGRAGIAIDRTEVETMRAGLARLIEAHRRVLDQLATGVAIFAADGKLTFYNAAFRSLFDLDAGFLDQTPTDGAVLDRLRADRKLPEEQDFRQWKAQLHEAYRAFEPKEHLWHLPDGRTLRVVTTPNPEGGVTYLYDDVTERLDMHRRYDALIKVQSETLDHLAEAVAVFGSDGRVRLHNPAFARMWKLQPEALDEHPHIEAVTAWCQALHDDNAVWRALRAAVTAIDDREPMTARIERRDGMVIDLATMPLPDGATLVTFQDVTDTVNVERVLRERNEALEEADEIKIEFVHHVSYELRSPLTNIIGFAHFLGDPGLRPAHRQAARISRLHHRLDQRAARPDQQHPRSRHHRRRRHDAQPRPRSTSAPAWRRRPKACRTGWSRTTSRSRSTCRPASAASPPTSGGCGRSCSICCPTRSASRRRGRPSRSSAERRPDAVVFTVVDHGPGIPPEAKDKVFDWFETDSRGSQHRGTGLGLSLVRSFVELHGGTVTIDSVLGQGTTVTCVFPTAPAAKRDETQSAA